VGELRFDPSRCSILRLQQAEYLSSRLEIGSKPVPKLPKIFYVNWFRKAPPALFVARLRENQGARLGVRACAGHGALSGDGDGLIPPVGGEGTTSAASSIRSRLWRSCCGGERRMAGPAATSYVKHFAKFESFPGAGSQMKALEERMG